MLRTVSLIVRGLNVFNWVAAALFVVLLVLTYVAEPRFLGAIASQFPGVGTGSVLADIRLVLLVGIASVVPAHVLLVRLGAILRSVEVGDAFVAADGARLRQMGWALLALQILDLGFGWVAVSVSAATNEYLGWSFSPIGWLSVLLVFVLSRVWTQGAAMRDELDATV